MVLPVLCVMTNLWICTFDLKVRKKFITIFLEFAPPTKHPIRLRVTVKPHAIDRGAMKRHNAVMKQDIFAMTLHVLLEHDVFG